MGWTFTQRLRLMRHGYWMSARALAAPGLLAAVLLLVWPPFSGAAASPKAPPPEPIDVTADALDADNPNKTADFTAIQGKQVVVSQGTMRVTADHVHATGYGETIQDGRWTFTGNVHIYAEPRGTLRSDQAVVDVRDKRMSMATATGNPAEFEQRHASTGELTHGHADIIVYDVAAGTVRLTNNAFITNGRNTITGPLVVYNVRQQRVLADSGSGTTKPGVHVTIVPQNSSGSGPGAVSPAPAPGPGASPPKKPQTP